MGIKKGNKEAAQSIRHHVSRKVTVNPIPAQEMDQALLRVTHTIGKYVEVDIATGSYAGDGEFNAIPSMQKHIMFTGPNYKMLLAPNPAWAPNKPEGAFKETDIFAFIDYLESIE